MRIAVCTIAMIIALPACAQDAPLADVVLPRQPAPENARLYIISPADGEAVRSPVTVKFGLQNMGVAPAGVEFENTGHHHVLIDLDDLPPLGLPMPADENHVHFGTGATEGSIEVTPGEHTLQLFLGDHLHIPHDPPVVSEKITIYVVE